MMQNVIGFFRQNEEYGFFSNWYRYWMVVDGVKFSSMEQWMMYSKAMLFKDTSIARKILSEVRPREIKALGRKVHSFDNEVWDENKFNIVVKGLKSKFAKDGKLWFQLDSTGDAILAECSPYDRIWGIGLSVDNPDIYYPEKWRGQNLLGKALMQTRKELREE